MVSSCMHDASPWSVLIEGRAATNAHETPPWAAQKVTGRVWVKARLGQPSRLVLGSEFGG
eukprot:6179329-Pleurochrysis_carterae.AAC.2